MCNKMKFHVLNFKKISLFVQFLGYLLTLSFLKI